MVPDERWIQSKLKDVYRKNQLLQYMIRVQYFNNLYNGLQADVIECLYMTDRVYRLFFVALYEFQGEDSFDS